MSRALLFVGEFPFLWLSDNSLYLVLEKGPARLLITEFTLRCLLLLSDDIICVCWRCVSCD